MPTEWPRKPAAVFAAGKAEGRRAKRVEASVLRPFDELRVAPSLSRGDKLSTP